MESPQDIKAIGRRLRLTRTALKLSQTEICVRMGFARNRWNQWERGKGRIGLDAALHLCEVFGLSLDWIYRGNMGALQSDLAKGIDRANIEAGASD